MTDLRNSADDWWILFPHRELVLTDDQLTLDDPLWGDATFISMKHASEVVKQLGLKKNAKNTDPEHDLLLMMGAITHTSNGIPLRDPWETPDSFICVRRKLIKGDVNRRMIPEGAFERAASVEAALTIGLLKKDRMGLRTCGLLRHGRPPIAPTTALETNGQGYVLTIGGPSKLFSPPIRTLEYTANGLKEVLASCPAKSLVRILLAQPNTADPKVYGNIRRAAARLVSACFTIGAEGQAVGLVTALELILPSDDGFKRLRTRVEVLLSDAPDSNGSIRRLLKARHDHVHQGKGVDPTVPYQSVRAVIDVLERVARCSTSLPSITAVGAYLDALSTTQRLSECADQSVVRSLLAESFPWEGDA